MVTTEAEAILGRGLKGLNLALDEEAVARLGRYFQELKKWSQRVNLIAKGATDLEILENHFLDSLTLLPFVRGAASPPPGGRNDLLDIGTGAGFPGLVLKAACPGLDVTLIEPRQKRVFFLNHIIRTLQLDRVKVVAAHLDRQAPSPLGPDQAFSIITSRALTDIGSFLEMAAAFCSPASRIICMKGPQGLAELKTFQESGPPPFRLQEISERRLPFSNAVRILLVFTKGEGQGVQN